MLLFVSVYYISDSTFNKFQRCLYNTFSSGLTEVKIQFHISLQVSYTSLKNGTNSVHSNKELSILSSQNLFLLLQLLKLVSYSWFAFSTLFRYLTALLSWSLYQFYPNLFMNKTFTSVFKIICIFNFHTLNPVINFDFSEVW